MGKNKASKKNIRVDFIKLIVALIFPSFLCFLYCFLRKSSLFSLYVPNAINNDCLFYYKQVEGILAYGMPRGFFGFNESHALIGSLGAWSPVIYLPWVIWGGIFGWNYSSVLASNICFFSVSFGGFILLAKPKWRDILFFFGSLMLFPSIPIHFLNVLPETVLASFMVLFFGLAFYYENSTKKGFLPLASMIVTAVFLTLIRPYMVLLLFLPGYYMVKKRSTPGFLLTLFAGVLSLAGYTVLSKYFTASYFSELYDLTSLNYLKEGKITDFLWYVKKTTIQVLPEISMFIKDAFRYGLTAGTQYAVVILSAVGAVILCFDRKNEKMRAVNICFAGTVTVLLAAIVLFLQKANEGGRHVWIFALTGILILCFNEWGVKAIAVRGLLFFMLAIFMFKGSFVPTDYDIPLKNDELKTDVEYWNAAFTEKNIVPTNRIQFENTVIWVLTDDVNGQYVITNHKELFGIPKGMGINCCLESYVKDHFQELKCNYIATTSGGSISKLCEASGMEEIGRTTDVVIYAGH